MSDPVNDIAARIRSRVAADPVLQKYVNERLGSVADTNPQPLTPISPTVNTAGKPDSSSATAGKPRAMGERIATSLGMAAILTPLTLGLAYLGVKMSAFTFHAWGLLASAPPDAGNALSNLIAVPVYYVFGFALAVVATFINLALVFMPLVAIWGPVARFRMRYDNNASKVDAVARKPTMPAPAQPQQHAEKRVSDGSGCSHCGEPYGQMASLGFQTGGYRCDSCGKRVCDRCCYRKAKSAGRATMLCPHCGSDNVTAFHVYPL